MSDRSFLRPARIPGKRFVLTKGMIEESQRHEAITEPTIPAPRTRALVVMNSPLLRILSH